MLELGVYRDPFLLPPEWICGHWIGLTWRLDEQIAYLLSMPICFVSHSSVLPIARFSSWIGLNDDSLVLAAHPQPFPVPYWCM